MGRVEFIEVTIQKMTAIVWVPHLVQVRSALEIMRNENDHVASGKKCKADCIPKLIANKRKHMEKQLSVAQRGQLLISEAKEYAHFQKNLALAMRRHTGYHSKAASYTFETG